MGRVGFLMTDASESARISPIYADLGRRFMVAAVASWLACLMRLRLQPQPKPPFDANAFLVKGKVPHWPIRNISHS